MSTSKSDIEMTPQFDRAEEILVQAGMHPVMARAVIEFARYGEQHGSCPSEHERTPAPGLGRQHGELLTTRQAAMRLGVSERQIYRLVMQGQLRNHVLGRQYRFAIRDLDALIEQTRAGARAARMARIAQEGPRAA